MGNGITIHYATVIPNIHWPSIDGRMHSRGTYLYVFLLPE
jgi:hypothetical protein